MRQRRTRARGLPKRRSKAITPAGQAIGVRARPTLQGSHSPPRSRSLPGRLAAASLITMVFSAKTAYGLVALMDLAVAHATGARVQTGEICRRHGMPERYLEQMLTALRKGGYLASVRGPKGGYQLTRAPESITIAEVEACLEGEARRERQGDRNDTEFQVLDALAKRVRKARVDVLQSTTLAHLLVERDRLREPTPMFYI